jgi:hypothetical protein
MNRRIFEKLKREGECWHEIVGSEKVKYYMIKRCSCGAGGTATDIKKHSKKANPDFSTPDGFFWIIERGPEWDKWGAFLEWAFDRKIVGKNKVGHKEFFVTCADRARFTEALDQFLKGEK